MKTINTFKNLSFMILLSVALQNLFCTCENPIEYAFASERSLWRFAPPLFPNPTKWKLLLKNASDKLQKLCTRTQPRNVNCNLILAKPRASPLDFHSLTYENLEPGMHECSFSIRMKYFENFLP